MIGSDLLLGVEIGDGAGDFQDAVVGPGAEVQLGHRHLHHAFGVGVQLAVRFDLAVAHPRVGARFAVAGEA